MSWFLHAAHGGATGGSLLCIPSSIRGDGTDDNHGFDPHVGSRLNPAELDISPENEPTMMTWRRLFQQIITSSAALGLIAGVVLGEENKRPPLPAVSYYQNLPARFNEILKASRDTARSQPTDPEKVRKLARLYQANRLYQEAKACYQVIAAAPPGLTARDHYYLADIAQNENDLAGAQTELRATLRTEPSYIAARLALATTLFKSGQEEEAEKEYSAVLAIEANQAQASVGLARIELQRGNDNAAVSRLEELMTRHPESTSGAALFAQVLERRGETDRAVAMSQLGMLQPETPLADPWMDALLRECYDIQRLSLVFEEYFKTGKTSEALPLLERLAELDPAGPISLMFRGFAHARALQHETAVTEYYEALKKGGDAEKVGPYLTQSLLALERVSEAANLIADCYAKLPDSIPIAKAYADVALRQKDDKLARVLLEKILQKEPYLQPQNMRLAEILWTSNERDAAAKCLQRVSTVHLNDVASRALLGEYYLHKSEPLSAIKPLEEASVYVPPSTPAQKNLIEMLSAAYLAVANKEADKGDFAEAVNYYEKAIRVAPGDLNGYAGKANACVQLKWFRRAGEALEKMSSLAPDNPTIYLSLGDVIYQDGNAQQAHLHWEMARQLVATGDKELKEALDLRLSGRITAETFK